MRNPRKKSRLSEIWRQLKKNKLAVIALFVLAFLVFVAIFAPLLAPYPYEQQNPKLSNAG